MKFFREPSKILPPALLFVVVCFGMSSPPPSASAPSPSPAVAQSSRVRVTGPVTPSEFTGDLRNLPRAPQWKPGDPIKEIPQRSVRQATGDHVPEARGFEMDPLAERQLATPPRETRAFSSSSLDFAGMGFTGVNPSDAVGDVGRDYYIQMVNGSGGSEFAIYNKSDGSSAAGPIVLDSLATGGYPCDDGLGDPIVLYDHLADRWLLSEFSKLGNGLCVYISKTSDPVAGGWWSYAFSMGTFPDYPKYAVWPDAYYVSTNQNPPAAHAMERLKMLQGAAATVQTMSAVALSGFVMQALTPADLDGSRLPPIGAPGIFMRHKDTEAHGPVGLSVDFLEFYELDVDWAVPGNTTFTLVANIAINEFDSDLCGLGLPRNCYQQPGSAVLLDSLKEVIMWRLVYRNFGTHEALVGSFETDFTGYDNAGIRWFEVRRTHPRAPERGVAYWQLHQEGTYVTGAPVLNLNHWMSSIAMDGTGNIALGFNIVNAITFPSLRYDGRLSSDPLGVMTNGSTTIVDGTAASSTNRYGDYNTMTLDPVDDCTFWFTGQYNVAASWSTRIKTFRFDRCGSAMRTFIGEESAQDEQK